MPKTPKIVKKIELPLLAEIRDFYTDIFRQEDPRRMFGVPKLPDYISSNLKHKLRSYQEEAVRSLNYTQKDVNASVRFNQLLFHMATGSGKTDVMAALVLYMYAEFRQQNFLFVVNTNAVVAKTRENLVNSSSSKYLLAENISINGEKLEIREVNRFPKEAEKGILYLRLVTVQTLASELSTYRENGLTYEELADTKLVILADEAHHFSAETKSSGSQKDRAWENVLDRIRQINPANRQFEFTATIDLQNEAIRNKYATKIVSQYELSRFVRAGYSKRVRYLQANAADEQKMLNAVLLSQYRKHIARQAGIQDFKPVILFKSNKIAISKQTRDKFLSLMDELTVEALNDFIYRSSASTNSRILKKVYAYFDSQSLASLVVELKRDFTALNTINVNDTASDGMLGDLNDLKNLNSLEEADNPFRVIFAVAKLSEGWDVLNLYDIVRISEGAESATSKNATNSEAQLVGRGARYFPFAYEGKCSYSRRFDEVETDLSVLEYLDYHTINEPKYLENLRKSLDEMDLPVEDDKDFDIYPAQVKDSFKRTKVYQSGKLYYNEVEEIPLADWDSIEKYNVQTSIPPEIDISFVVEEAESQEEVETNLKTLDLSADTNKALLRKAIARNPFYRFNNLKNYLPNLTSISEFLRDENWLGAIPKLNVKISINDELTRERELLVADRFLAYIQRQILMNYKRSRGTNRFTGISISDVVRDYAKKVARMTNSVIEAHISSHDTMRYEWFPHDTAVVDGLEWNLVQQISTLIDDLRIQYGEVYLIRNDKRDFGLTLHAFAGEVTHYAGFMPDFILYLENQQEIIQVYIEPKGLQLLEQDQWKEDLLSSLNTAEIILETEKVKLIGVRFYTTGDLRGTISELQTKVLPESMRNYVNLNLFSEDLMVADKND